MHKSLSHCARPQRPIRFVNVDEGVNVLMSSSPSLSLSFSDEVEPPRAAAPVVIDLVNSQPSQPSQPAEPSPSPPRRPSPVRPPQKPDEASSSSSEFDASRFVTLLPESPTARGSGGPRHYDDDDDIVLPPMRATAKYASGGRGKRGRRKGKLPPRERISPARSSPPPPSKRAKPAPAPPKRKQKEEPKKKAKPAPRKKQRVEEEIEDVVPDPPKEPADGGGGGGGGIARFFQSRAKVEPSRSAEEFYILLRQEDCAERNPAWDQDEISDILRAQWLSAEPLEKAPFLKLAEIDAQRERAEKQLSK